MQSSYAEHFDREMGCTEAEWLAWLPNAIGAHRFSWLAKAVSVEIDAGQLAITWRAAEPRVIAQVCIPRLLVSFRFTGLDEAQRYLFMKRFDLYLQRGGG